MQLCASGAWFGPVQTPPSPSQGTLSAAELLRAQLARMAGDPGIQAVQPGQPGFRVGTYEEWSAYELLDPPAWLVDPQHDHVIQTTTDSVLIVARDGEMLDRAVWRFLQQLGYRQFFPTATWEIVPQVTDLSLFLDLRETRGVTVTSGWGLGGGLMAYAVAPIREWTYKNGVGGEATILFGHAWGAIVAANQAIFDAHPEYVSATGSKLTVLEPEVQAVATQWAMDSATTHPTSLTVSMSAADGSAGWTEDCLDTQAGMTPSDRQAYLAVRVQDALDQDPATQGLSVAILAYGDTSTAPVQVDGRLLIVAAEAFILDGRTYEDVVAQYQAAGATRVAPYGYLSVYTWDHDEPGASRSSHVGQMEVEAARGRAAGLYTHEGSDAWGPSGLGYYVLAQMLAWGTATQVLREDFLVQAFPTSTDAARDFYDLLEAGHLLTTDLIHRLYQAVQDGLSTTPDQPEADRWCDLAVFVRRTELWYQHLMSPNQDTYEDLLAFVYRIQTRQMVSWRMLFYDPVRTTYVDGISAKYGYPVSWNATDGHPWPGTPVDRAEVEAFVTAGIANNPLRPYETVRYSSDLVFPAWPADGRPRGTYLYAVNPAQWNLVAREPTVSFQARAGIAYQNKGDGYLRVVDPADQSVLYEWMLPPDKVTRTYTAVLPTDRLLLIQHGGGGGTYLSWDPGTGVSRESTVSPTPWPAGSWGGYFWVPPGTAVVGGYSNGAVTKVYDQAGVLRWSATEVRQFFSIPVPAGQDGKVWRFVNCNGPFAPETVPNQVALHPTELLVPTEVQPQP